MGIKTEEQKIKTREKWFWIIFILLLISIITIILSSSHTSILSPNYNKTYKIQDICSSIQGTPAWVQNNQIIGYGEEFVGRYTQKSYQNEVKDYLIPNKITFVWDNKCIHCHNEISRWGQENWLLYQKSNLTKECHIL